jgi:hypothetical protein
MINLDFKKGMLVGSLISGSFTFIFTKMYVNKNSIFIPSNEYILDVYKQMIFNNKQMIFNNKRCN